jgi:hypothetical protein
MRKITLSGYAAHTLFTLGFLLIIVATGTKVAYAQCSGPCPTASTGTTYPQGVTVYVDIDAQIQGTPQETQIRNGLESWNAANSANGSNVNFVVGQPPADLPTANAYLLHVINGTLTDPNGQTLPGTVARFHRNAYDASGNVRDGLLTFNTGSALVDPSDPSRGPYYDPNQPGYDTIFQKETEHEIGHSLGLNDVDDVCRQYGQSVMNHATDCANDNCGAKPVGVAQCDSNAVGAEARYQPPPPPDPPPPVCVTYDSQFWVFNGGCLEEYTIRETYCDGYLVNYYIYLSGFDWCIG